MAVDRYGKRVVPTFAGCLSLAVLTVRTNFFGLLPLAFFPVPLIAVAAIFATVPFSLYRECAQAHRQLSLSYPSLQVPRVGTFSHHSRPSNFIPNFSGRYIKTWIGQRNGNAVELFAKTQVGFLGKGQTHRCASLIDNWSWHLSIFY